MLLINYHEEFLTNERSNWPKEIIQNKNYNNSNSKDLVLFQNVGFKYENKDTEALKKLNFKIFKNEMLAILGKSGAGKTTLINLILGLLKPTQGKIIKIFKTKFYFTISILIDDTLKNNIALGVEEKKVDLKE